MVGAIMSSSSAGEPKVLTTAKQRALRTAFRAAGARTRLPSGFRIAKAAGASGRRDGMGRMIADIMGNVLEERDAERQGQWRFEALLSKHYDIVDSEEQTANVCVICFDEPVGDPARPCAHAFACAECAALFVGGPCPICRADIDSVGPVQGQVFMQAADLAPETYVVFRAPSAGGKRSAAWRNGFRDDIVLLRDYDEIVAALREIADAAADFTVLADFAAAAPSIYWSVVALACKTANGDTVIVDGHVENMLFGALDAVRSGGDGKKKRKQDGDDKCSSGKRDKK